MSKRISLLTCAFAFMFLAACAGSKTSGGSSYYDDSDEGGSGGGGGGKSRASSEPRAPRPDELKEAKSEASALTEENHKLAKEVFDLKAKMGIVDD